MMKENILKELISVWDLFTIFIFKSF
jgi:hypothetical protein